MKVSRTLIAISSVVVASSALALFLRTHQGSPKQHFAASGARTTRPDEAAGESRGTAYLESLNYFIAERAYPGTAIDWSMYTKATTQMRKTSMLPPAGNVWTYLGPNNLDSPSNPDNQYQGPSQLAGRVNCVAYGPQTRFGQIIYCGSATGGFYQGIYERQGSWVEMSDSTWPTYAVSCCAVSPNGTDIIVGTGDFEGVLPNPPGCRGLMESFDGGATWANLAAPFVPAGAAPVVPMISRLAMDPDTFDDTNRKGVVLATTGRSSGSLGGIEGPPNRNYVTLGNLRISTDQGRTWRIAPGTPGAAAGTADAVWSACAVSPRSPTTGLRYYYAVAWIPGTGAAVWRSDDQGNTWHRTATNPFVNAQQVSMDIACSPNLSDNVYVISGGGTAFGGYGDQTVMKSTNGGNTWTAITGNIPNDGAVGGAGYDWTQSYYDYTIAVTSQPAAGGGTPNDVVFVGLIDLASAVQDGPNNAVWTWQGRSYDVPANPHLTHNDDHTLAFNPSNPNQGIFGNDGGAYGLTPNAGAPGRWSFAPFNQKLHVEEFYNMSFLPNIPGRQSYYTGGCQDIAAPYFKTGAAGPTSDWNNALQIGDGGYSVIVPGNPTTQFQGGTFSGGTVAMDGTVTPSAFYCYTTANAWVANPPHNISTYLPPPPAAAQPFERGAFIPPMIRNPGDGSLLLGTNHLWQWTPAGGADGTWTLYHNDNTQLIRNGTDYVRAIATSITGSYFYTGSLAGSVWVNLPNFTWVRIDRQGLANGLPNRTVTGIAVDPKNPKHIWVTLSGPTGAGRVFECADTTVATPQWANVSGNILDVPACCIAIDPNNSNHLEVGTDMGVYTSFDDGVSWTNYTAPFGLPVVSVRAIDFKFVMGMNYISIATFGRGAWQYAYPSTKLGP